MEEADQSCVCLGSLPVVHEVLERCKELHDAALDLRSHLVLLSEEKDEVLLHGQITGVDCTIDLGCVEDAMVINLVNELLEVFPGRQAQFQFFLGTYEG